MYKKILIKSEEDLPKIKGKYIFGWEKTETDITEGISNLPFNPNDYDIEDYFMDNVSLYNWYLIESPMCVPTDKEAIDKIYELEFESGFQKDRAWDLIQWAIDEILKRNK